MFPLSTQPTAYQLQLHLRQLKSRWGIDQILLHLGASGRNHVLKAQLRNLQHAFGKPQIQLALNRLTVEAQHATA